MRDALLLQVVLDVAHQPTAGRPWLEFAHFAQRPDLGALVDGLRQVVVVERVLGAVVAADIALADQPAGGARCAVEIWSAVRVGYHVADGRWPARSCEGHAQRR